MGRIRNKRGSLSKGVGSFGESWAKAYLEGVGYRILEQNFRCRLGEIDLVAQEGGEIAFVEVKARRGRAFGYPEEQIPASKRRRLGRLAQWYLKRYRKSEQPARFDVVTLLMSPGGKIEEVGLIRNAFSV